MNYQEARAFIHQTQSSGIRMGLDRVRELLKRMGDPQKGLRILHVAGTNGKGSVCAMTAQILQEAGYRTGMFTSPELFGFETQFLVNGEPMTKEEVIHLAESMKPAVDAMADPPSEFEIITAMALLYFRQKACDFVVLETGMGGISDATNVIDPPEVAAIVNIGMDHMQYLGNSLQEIAEKKAGIIKRGSRIVLADQKEDVQAVLKQACQQADCRYRISDNRQLRLLSESLQGQSFHYKDYRDLYLPLLGAHQRRNAAIVLEIVETLKELGYVIPQTAVRMGLAKVTWPGRMEVLSQSPLLLVDGAHNPHGVEALAENIRSFFPGQKLLFMCGILADKDYRTMLKLVVPYAAGFITMEPQNARALSAEECAAAIRDLGEDPAPVYAGGSPGEALGLALQLARKENLPIIAFGSLYNVQEIRSMAKELL